MHKFQEYSAIYTNLTIMCIITCKLQGVGAIWTNLKGIYIINETLQGSKCNNPIFKGRSVIFWNFKLLRQCRSCSLLLQPLPSLSTMVQPFQLIATNAILTVRSHAINQQPPLPPPTMPKTASYSSPPLLWLSPTTGFAANFYEIFSFLSVLLLSSC